MPFNMLGGVCDQVDIDMANIANNEVMNRKESFIAR